MAALPSSGNGLSCHDAAWRETIDGRIRVGGTEEEDGPETLRGLGSFDRGSPDIDIF